MKRRLVRLPANRKRSDGEARAHVWLAWQLLSVELGCEPTVRQLAAKCKRVPSTVQHHLVKLRAEGKLAPRRAA